MDISQVGQPDTVIQGKSLRFVFEARKPIHFSEGRAGNTLREAFGTIFHQLACAPECQSARQCERRLTCPYAQMFEPSGPAPTGVPAPSGLKDWPRPFVFRASHLDGLTTPAGGTFHFEVNLFHLKGDAENYLATVFGRLAEQRLGAGRKRAELMEVESPSV